MGKGSFISPEQRSGIRARVEPIALAMHRAGLTPNMLTLIGFGIASLGGVLAAFELWLLAGIVATAGAGFDMFDGAVARATGQVSKLGAFMDSTFDRWGEGIVYLGIVIGSTRAGFDLGAWLATAALVSAFMVSYTRAKSESLGFSSGTGMAAVGFAPREVRTVILGLAVVGAGIFGVTPELSDLGSLLLGFGRSLLGGLSVFLVLGGLGAHPKHRTGCNGEQCNQADDAETCAGFLGHGASRAHSDNASESIWLTDREGNGSAASLMRPGQGPGRVVARRLPPHAKPAARY